MKVNLTAPPTSTNAQSRWLFLALWFTAGCGRLGVELIAFTQDNVCVLGVCSNDVDRCPGDDGKVGAGICGCGISDSADQDGDGTPDCIDLCPNQADRLSNGSCGCAAASEDSDGDGTLNCQDRCPYDNTKLAAQVCGCGMPDTDSDGDGMPDCADECPDDASKVVSGKCGCGVPENSRDIDNDGKLDCVDLCNGVDDARYVPNGSCGIGYCSTNTTPSSCASGVETECRPGPAKSAVDASCDGVDDDCDGSADEEFAAASTVCGTGSCVAQGTLTCVSGKALDSCKANNPAINDMTCDGVDDDCDGQLDEDFQPHASSCGNGVCAANGTVTCVSGAEVDSCVAGAPTGADTDCNGVDENCDGTTDEGYAGTSTSCGMGACATTGMYVCVEGSVVDSCKPGTMAPDDVTCDGVDDNCNGTKDEGYVPVASMCGTGACTRAGQINCVSGKPSDTCRPGAAAANDSSCNGVDDDCNGQVDEDYVVPTSTCGVGVCQRSGVINCVGGSTQNTCVAGAPSSSNDGPPANGLDDDCDGSIDEDACVPGAPRTYSVGSYANIAVPAGCLTANIRLWGGGGGAGDQTSVGETGTPGRGGSGGYSETTITIGGALNLYVGNGGAGCGAGGTNPGATTYNGGAGAPGGFAGAGKAGSDGQDGVVAGGGAGATAGSGNGGRGYYGGGGGGTGTTAPWPPYPGGGGGGGAATVLLVGSTRVLVAGGGGGGGGVNGSSIASNGGTGGEGCSGAGGANDGAAGGGGGVCVGTWARGSNGVPANSGSIPAGRASGGTGVCGGGGGGYAIVTFSR